MNDILIFPEQLFKPFLQREAEPFCILTIWLFMTPLFSLKIEIKISEPAF